MDGTEIKSICCKRINDLAEENDVPYVDLVLNCINMQGINYNPTGYSARGDLLLRGRFDLFPHGTKRSFFMATSITRQSRFIHDGKKVSLGPDVIGLASPPEKDTCDTSYFRKDGKALTLNSNQRNSCRGCKFCGTYSLESSEKSLSSDKKALSLKIEELITERKETDASFLENIGVVTGCFPAEEDVLRHLLLVRETFEEYGFRGELRYIGSQIQSEKNLTRLARSGPFGLYLTVECFERRNDLLKTKKAAVTLDTGRDILNKAKSIGIETSFLYILGLDSIERMSEEFNKYLPVLTRHPLVNLLQAYTPEQESLRFPEANNLEYYIKARKEIEQIMKPTGLVPMLWDNYRSPWATRYADKEIV